MLNLSHLEDEEGKSSPVFAGESYDEKVAVYDAYEESDDKFHENLLQKLIYYVSFWYVGRVNNQEEFQKLLAENEGIEDKVGEAVAEELAKEEPKPKQEVKEIKNAPKEEQSQGKMVQENKPHHHAEKHEAKQLAGANKGSGGGSPNK